MGDRRHEDGGGGRRAPLPTLAHSSSWPSPPHPLEGDDGEATWPLPAGADARLSEWHVAWAAGGEAIAVSMDVTDEASTKAAYDAAEAAVGTVDTIIAAPALAHDYERLLQRSVPMPIDTHTPGRGRLGMAKTITICRPSIDGNCSTFANSSVSVRTRSRTAVPSS